MSHIVDERAEFRVFGDSSSDISRARDEDTQLQKVQTRLTPQEKLIGKYSGILRAHFHLDDTTLNVTLDMFKNYLQEVRYKRHQKWLVVLAGCVYCASICLKRGLHVHQVCCPLNITRAQVFNVLAELMQAWKTNKWYTMLSKSICIHNDKLTRLVYSFSFVKESDIWAVMKTARKLHEKVSCLPHFNTVKSYTLNACCAFIALQVHNNALKRNEYCQMLGISLPTLSSHETMIQKALVNLVSVK
jgi:hypothetical protein